MFAGGRKTGGPLTGRTADDDDAVFGHFVISIHRPAASPNGAADRTSQNFLDRSTRAHEHATHVASRVRLYFTATLPCRSSGLRQLLTCSIIEPAVILNEFIATAA